MKLRVNLKNNEEEYDNFDKNEVQRIIINRIKLYRLIQILTNISMCLLVLSGINDIFATIFIYALIIRIISFLFIKLNLIYDMDLININKYFIILEILKKIRKANKIWFSADGTVGKRNIDRVYLDIKDSSSFIESNIGLYYIPLVTKKLIILPNKLLYINNNQYRYINYEDLEIELYTVKVLEDKIEYIDSELISSDDNNKYLYGKISIKNIDLDIYISNYHLLYSISELISRYKYIGHNEEKVLKIFDKLENRKKTQEKEKQIDNKKNNTEITNFRPAFEKDYKVPTLEVLKKQESFNIKPFIKEIKKQKETMVPIGLKENGELYLEKISEIKNLLIAGTVMAGKTTYLKTIIDTILMTRKPNETRLLLYSNALDLYEYNGIPHLIMPVCGKVNLLGINLCKVAKEIDKRVDILGKFGKRNADAYNNLSDNKMADIIVLIDDQSNSILNEMVRNQIEYISVNGPRVGVYMIIATNPILNNQTFTRYYFPSRLSFRVNTREISNFVIGDIKARYLSKPGAAYYISNFNTIATYLEVPFISDSDSTNIIDYWRNN
ncbi:hypothetical protein EGP99_05880 [bacterium]|nr:hypothetical protein [bacterium]